MNDRVSRASGRDRLSQRAGPADHFAGGSGLLFDQAMAQTRMAVCLTDPSQQDNPIIFANRAFFALTGYGPDEVIGRNCRFLQGPDTDPEAVQRIRDAIAQEDVCIIEVLNYRKEGTAFWNALHLGPIYREDGALQYYFGSQWNVSDVYTARAEEQHARMLARELSHRVKNMFSVINAVVALTARQESAPWIAEKVNARISALGRAYEATLDDAHRRRVLLSDVVRLVLEPYATQSNTTRSNRERIAVGGPEVVLDPNTVSTLGLVLHELATVSIRDGALASEEGRVSVGWQLASPGPDATLSLSWTETGTRTDRAPASELGSGMIGVLVRGAKGEIHADRGQDGIVTIVRLPVATRGPDPARTRDPETGAPKHGPLAGRTILVLEDEAMIALEMQMALEEAGATVELAMTADSALSLLERRAFDAAVLDVNLGNNTTCADVAARLRSMSAPFVLHSGDLRRHGELVETLAAPVVPKPASTGEITHRLAQLLDG